MFLECDCEEVDLVDVGKVDTFVTYSSDAIRWKVYANMIALDQEIAIFSGSQLECGAYMDKLKCALAERGELISKP